MEKIIHNNNLFSADKLDFSFLRNREIVLLDNILDSCAWQVDKLFFLRIVSFLEIYSIIEIVSSTRETI